MKRQSIKGRTILVFAVLVALALTLSTFPARAADTDTITYWHTHSDAESAQLDKLITMFEQENPGINIEQTHYAYDDFKKALLTAIAAGQAPDVIRMDIVWVPQFAQQGALLQLDSAMPDFKQIAGAV